MVQSHCGQLVLVLRPRPIYLIILTLWTAQQAMISLQGMTDESHRNVSKQEMPLF